MRRRKIFNVNVWIMILFLLFMLCFIIVYNTDVSYAKRNEGTWYWPTDKNCCINDYAGCYSGHNCLICGEKHPKWDDTYHTTEATAHRGIDIGSSNHNIYAANYGTVVYYKYNDGRGNTLIIEHTIAGSEFSYYSLYQHLASNVVGVGDDVEPGQTIAKMGNTGGKYETHLHFEMFFLEKGYDFNKKGIPGNDVGFMEYTGKSTGIVNTNVAEIDGSKEGFSRLASSTYHAGSIQYVTDKTKVTRLNIDTSHIHDFNIFVSTKKEATCTENGINVMKCSCGETSEVVVQATGHTEVIDPAIPATDYTTGLSEGIHCSVCGKTLIEQKEINKTTDDYCTVTFISREGYIYGEQDETVLSYQNVKNESLSDWCMCENRPGYYFVGWKEQGKDTIYTLRRYDYKKPNNKENIGLYIPQKNTTFYAVWAKECEITWIIDEGFLSDDLEFGTNQELIGRAGIGDSLDNYTGAGHRIRTGYFFVGWKTDNDDTLYRVNDLEFTNRWFNPVDLADNEDYIWNYIPYDNVRFYAQFKKLYSVTFSSEEGFIYGFSDSYTENYEVVDGQLLNEIYTCYNRPKYHFIGWKIDGDDNVYLTERKDRYASNEYYIGDYVVKSDVVFKAIWEFDNEEPINNDQPDGKQESNDESKRNNQSNNTKEINDNDSSSNNNSPDISYNNEWINGKWYNTDGTQTYNGILMWKCNSTGWWVEDTAGWYPVSSWQKIDGVWYYFKADGYMASNEYYGGYWLNSDGSLNDNYYIIWKSNSVGWWIEDKSGWWPSNTWVKIDGNWYYFDSFGYMVTNQYVDGYWIGADGVCY